MASTGTALSRRESPHINWSPSRVKEAYRRWRRRTADVLPTRSTNAYRPLDSTRQEIRLLVVEPGSGDEMIDCSFRHVYLDVQPKPEYETISYVWGNANLRAALRLEGQYIQVPASSERVLRRFRLPIRRRILWIDAVCINQHDREERSSQVALMYGIYSFPIRNLVWLGEDNGTTRTALDCIYRLVEDMRVETDDFNNASDMLHSEICNIRFAIVGLSFSLLPEETDAIVQFYSSEWFRRLWVVQEATLAPISICYLGEYQFPLQDVLRAAKWLYHKTYHLPPELSNVPGTINAMSMLDFSDKAIGIYQNRRWRTDVLDVLANINRFEASDHRDYVFGILGLASKCLEMDEIPTLLRPDYTKLTSAVFRDLAIYCIQQRQDLAILDHVRHRLDDPSSLVLPTWVPAWNQSPDVELDADHIKGNLFIACSKERSRISNLDQSHNATLTVTGIVFAETGMVSVPIQSAKRRVLLKQKVFDIDRQFRSFSNNDKASVQPDRLELAMTLTWGRNHVDEPWNHEHCIASSIAYDEATEGDGVLYWGDLTAASTDKEYLAAEFGQSMYQNLRNHCLFTTKSGNIGLGPQTMQSGDIVAILYGCSTPVVLRRLEAEEDEYNFVGACYVYGIMHGEAVDAHLAAGEEDVVFKLV